jgi:hypothetical protein
LRGARILDLIPPSAAGRKHYRAATARPRQAQGGALAWSVPRRILLVVESEGAVFDSLRQRHEACYMPSFASLFAWGIEPSVCSALWRNLALFSRMRGEEPAVILLAALRRLNRIMPSVRRSALAGILEAQIRDPDPQALIQAARREGSLECLIMEWMQACDSLLADLAPAPLFPEASDFLAGLPPETEVLVHSCFPEASALNRWETAGLGSSFLRLAGSERGSFPDYLRAALKNGYDSCPILVAGTTASAWQAAQNVGARFFPILPGAEAASWKELAGDYFPALRKGATALSSRGAQEFMKMLYSDGERGL